MALLTMVASAQSDTAGIGKKKHRNFKLDAHAGYSIGFGKYTSTEKDDKQSGYAANGFFVQVEGSWLGKSGLGLGAGYCYQNSWIQESATNDTLVGQYTELGSKHWSNHYLLGGPVFIRNFGKLLLTIKLQAGAVLAFSPVFRLWMPSTDTLNPNTMTLSDGPGAGVAMQAMAGIGYRVTDNLTINLAFSYLGGNPNRTKSYSQLFKDGDTGLYYYTHGELERKKKISTLNIGLGLVFKL